MAQTSTPRPRTAAGLSSNRRRADWSTAVLLAPACVLFAVFVVYPIIGSINLSLHDWNGVGERTWVGLGNYRELLTDPVFARALANNLRWLGGYLLAPLFGLALALALNQPLFGIRVIRTLFFMPFVLSQVVVGLVFAWFFHSRFGLFDNLLEMMGLPRIAPLESEGAAIYTVIIAGLWPQIAYCMILFLTGLAALRDDLIDAARVDGASGWPLFRHAVLPQLRPVGFIVAIVCAVSALRSFDYVMIMTLGGPYNSSTVLAYYMYEQTFVHLRYGYGAAIAIVMLALMSAMIVMLLVRMFRKEGR